MGRRLFFLLGFLVCPLLDWQPAWAQAPKAQENKAQDASAAPEPSALPVVGGLPPVADEPSVEAPKTAAKKKGGRLVPAPIDPEVIRTQAAGDANANANAPAPAAAASSPPATVPAGQAPAPADGSMEGQGSPLSTDRLPLGKQEVMVSVEVQSPANLNYEQPATVKIIVKNSGSTDALGVVVRDELPPGLFCVSSQPEAQRVGDLLSWRISTLPAGSDRVILLKVKPTRVGAFDHAATVTFQAGSKATSRVLRPRLKVEVVQNPTDGKVLKNKTAEFRIAITNTGDGPARDVVVHAKLSPGLRHDSSERNEDNSFELPIQQINPGQREELDPLTVDAIQGGAQWCRVNATSTDVVFAKDEAEVTRNIEVVEPKLKLDLVGPEKRYTDTVAPYTLTLENLGSAPARNVRVLVTLGVSGRLVAIPPGAKYDSASRRLQWTIPQIDPGAKPRTLGFEVRMGGISAYEVHVETRADNAIYLKDRKITDVQGMPDVDLRVTERRRVVDVDGTTTFQIRLRNYGTKEATKLLVRGKVSDNLVIVQTAGGPEQEAQSSPDGHGIVFPIIERLGPGKEMIMGIQVKVTGPQRKSGVCRVYLTHDDLTEELEDMARVNVTETHRAAVTGP